MSGELVCTISSESDSATLMKLVSQVIKPDLQEKGVAIGFTGELGAGKTFMVRALVEALGGCGVCSPSYVLENRYPLPQGHYVEHWDIYRLGRSGAHLGECEDLAVFYPPSSGILRVIEWVGLNQELYAEMDLLVEIEFSAQVDPEEQRTVRLGGQNLELLEQIARLWEGGLG